MERDIFEALGNPIRRKILILLNEKPRSYKELASELGISIGSLYYHLSYLKPFITQDDMKRYTLNESGKEIVRDIVTEKIKISMPNTITRVSRILTFNPILHLIALHPSLPSSTFIICILLEALMLMNVKSAIALTIPYMNVSNYLVTISSLLGTVVILIIVSILVCKLLNKMINYMLLIGGMPISILPIILYSYLILSLGIPSGIREIMYYPFTLWFMGIYARLMKLSTGVKYSYSLIICLLICYISLALTVF